MKLSKNMKKLKISTWNCCMVRLKTVFMEEELITFPTKRFSKLTWESTSIYWLSTVNRRSDSTVSFQKLKSSWLHSSTKFLRLTTPDCSGFQAVLTKPSKRKTAHKLSNHWNKSFVTVDHKTKFKSNNGANYSLHWSNLGNKFINK